MNLANLNLVLRTRALTDAGSGGLFLAGSNAFCNAWNWNQVPPDTTFPYVVQSIAGLVSDNAFQRDIAACRVRFAIWHEKSSLTDPDPYLTVSRMESRIYGNWSSATPTVAPTYGFHRFAPAFSGWTGTQMEFTQTLDESGGDYLNFVMEFKFWISQ